MGEAEPRRQVHRAEKKSDEKSGKKLDKKSEKKSDSAKFPEHLEQATVEELQAEPVQAWELIDAEAGQYMPRRIRGSFRGRALG